MTAERDIGVYSVQDALSRVAASDEFRDADPVYPGGHTQLFLEDGIVEV